MEKCLNTKHFKDIKKFSKKWKKEKNHINYNKTHLQNINSKLRYQSIPNRAFFKSFNHIFLYLLIFNFFCLSLSNKIILKTTYINENRDYPIVYIEFIQSSISDIKVIDPQGRRDYKFCNFKIENNYYFINCIERRDYTIQIEFNSEINNATQMFKDIGIIQELDFNDFQMSGVTDMQYMFSNCFNLHYIDMSNFQTNNYIISNNMFELCSNLYSIKLPTTLKTFSNMNSMFYGCNSLESIDLTKITIIN